MARRLKLALIGFLMVTSAHANGSMGQDVRVIVVHPSAQIKAISEARQFDRQERQRIKDEAKAEAKAAAKAEKAAEKARAAADKAYEKKLANQRKKK